MMATKTTGYENTGSSSTDTKGKDQDPAAQYGEGSKDANPGMRDAGGWAGTQNFNPAELETIYDEPWRILPYVFSGMPVGGAGYSRLRNMPADPAELNLLTRGATGILTGSGQGATDDQKTYGAAQYANFLNDLYSNYGSAGGQGFNSADLLANIFAQDVSGGPGDAQTSLAQLLAAGDSTTQARTLYNLVRSATAMGMDPLAQQAMQAAYLAALDQYGADQLTRDSGDTQQVVDYIRQNNPWLTGI